MEDSQKREEPTLGAGAAWSLDSLVTAFRNTPADRFESFAQALAAASKWRALAPGVGITAEDVQRFRESLYSLLRDGLA